MSDIMFYYWCFFKYILTIIQSDRIISSQLIKFKTVSKNMYHWFIIFIFDISSIDNLKFNKSIKHNIYVPNYSSFNGE